MLTSVLLHVTKNNNTLSGAYPVHISGSGGVPVLFHKKKIPEKRSHGTSVPHTGSKPPHVQLFYWLVSTRHLSDLSVHFMWMYHFHNSLGNFVPVPAITYQKSCEVQQALLRFHAGSTMVLCWSHTGPTLDLEGYWGSALAPWGLLIVHDYFTMVPHWVHEAYWGSILRFHAGSMRNIQVLSWFCKGSIPQGLRTGSAAVTFSIGSQQ